MPLPGILGGFETRQKHFFHIFGARKKNQKIFFPGKIGIYPKNRRFFAEIFSNDFFHGFFFSTPTDNRKIAEKSAEISDFFFLAYHMVKLMTIITNNTSRTRPSSVIAWTTVSISLPL